MHSVQLRSTHHTPMNASAMCRQRIRLLFVICVRIVICDRILEFVIAARFATFCAERSELSDTEHTAVTHQEW